MAFLTLFFPKRIRQIFYSLAAKMCDFILQKIMSFNLKGIVFLLGILTSFIRSVSYGSLHFQT